MFVVSITGRSGSGKSTLARELALFFRSAGWSATTVHLDDFYIDGLNILQYDSPDSIDWDAFQQHLGLIVNTLCPSTNDTIATHPVDIIIIEGLFPLPRPADYSIHLTLSPLIAWYRREQRGNCDPRIPKTHVDHCAALFCKPTPAIRKYLVSPLINPDRSASRLGASILRHIRGH